MPPESHAAAKASVLCQKQKRSGGLDEMLARESHLPLKRVNSFGKKWNISVRENTARGRRNKRLRSAYPKLVAPECHWRRRRAVERGSKRSVISLKAER